MLHSSITIILNILNIKVYHIRFIVSFHIQLGLLINFPVNQLDMLSHIHCQLIYTDIPGTVSNALFTIINSLFPTIQGLSIITKSFSR